LEGEEHEYDELDDGWEGEVSFGDGGEAEGEGRAGEEDEGLVWD